MKIAQITPYEYPYPGGVTEHVFHLDRCFRAWGHDVKIIAPVSGEEEDLPENVIRISDSIVGIPFGGSISRVTLSPKIYWPLKHLLRREQFDVVHLHEPLTPALAIFALRHSKTVTVGTFHAYREKRSISLETLASLFQPLVDKLDARICVSEPVLELNNRYFPGDYRVIPNGIDLARFGPQVQPIERFKDGRPNILFVGRLEERKGFRYLMRAFPYIVEAFPDARLMVVGAFGKEDKEPFVRYARMHNLHGVRFIGRVPTDDLASYYKTCDVFCAPSTGFESFGIVLLEAMAAGKPIVATNIAGYRSVVADGREGLLVEPQNEQALAKAIIRLLQDQELARAMGADGRRRAELYDWPIIARRILDLYEELLRKKETAQINAQ